jgi:hypothetical protein
MAPAFVRRRGRLYQGPAAGASASGKKKPARKNRTGFLPSFAASLIAT